MRDGLNGLSRGYIHVGFLVVSSAAEKTRRAGPGESGGGGFAILIFILLIVVKPIRARLVAPFGIRK